ncbi:MAG: glycerol-3-phosphate acyltransferase [Bacillus subtilis]|nr:glycerol-3-phosphate acyltransferase [Bacillus subtilis]
MIATISTAALIVYRHRANYKRLRRPAPKTASISSTCSTASSKAS